MASQESGTNESAQPVKSTPKDALVMAAILKEIGVTEYEPQIINQMIEFSYRYVTDIIEDSRVYSLHANRKTINMEDVKLAVSQKLDQSFTSPPPREFLLDVARTKNAQPLPLISDKSGLRLPPERHCLTSTNYKIKTTKKSASKKAPAASKNLVKINTAAMASGMRNTQQIITHTMSPAGVARFPQTLKRKHDDDYDT